MPINWSNLVHQNRTARRASLLKRLQEANAWPPPASIVSEPVALGDDEWQIVALTLQGDYHLFELIPRPEGDWVYNRGEVKPE